MAGFFFSSYLSLGAGKRLLAAAVAEHDTWDSAAAMKTIRFTDQQASQVCLPLTCLNSSHGMCMSYI